MLDTQTEEERVKKNLEKAMLQKIQAHKWKEEEARRKAQQESEQKDGDDSGKEKSEGERSDNEEVIEEEDDEIEYEVFYNDNDIRQTLVNQDQNLFNDLIGITKKIYEEYNGISGL